MTTECPKNLCKNTLLYSPTLLNITKLVAIIFKLLVFFVFAYLKIRQNTTKYNFIIVFMEHSSLYTHTVHNAYFDIVFARQV